MRVYARVYTHAYLHVKMWRHPFVISKWGGRHISDAEPISVVSWQRLLEVIIYTTGQVHIYIYIYIYTCALYIYIIRIHHKKYCAHPGTKPFVQYTAMSFLYETRIDLVARFSLMFPACVVPQEGHLRMWMRFFSASAKLWHLASAIVQQTPLVAKLAEASSRCVILHTG